MAYNYVTTHNKDINFSEYVAGPGTVSGTCRFEFKEYFDPDNNKTKIQGTFYVKASSGAGFISGWCGAVNFAGIKISYTLAGGTPSYSEFTQVGISKSIEIQHNADGTAPQYSVTFEGGRYYSTVEPDNRYGNTFGFLVHNSYDGSDVVVGFNAPNYSATYSISSSHKLTINANGGIWTDPVVYWNVQGATQTIPTPTRIGYTFNSWTKNGDGSLSGTTYTYGTSDCTLTAKWTINSYNVNLTAGDYITSVSGGGQKNYNSSVTVTAVLDSSSGYTYTFDGWYQGNTKVSSSLSYTFTMGITDVSLTAKGKRTTNSYTVSITAGDYIASVSGGGTKTYGSSVTVKAVLGSATGYTYTFDGWYKGTQRVSTSLNYTFTMGASNVSLVAKATRAVNEYTLTISQGAGSTIVVKRTSSPNKNAATGTLSNNSKIYYGDVLSATFSANTGYNISTRKINNTSVSSPATHTVTGNTTVSSTATLKTYTLSISTSSSGITTTINRTSSPIGHGSTGVITNGATLYYNDIISINYTISPAYQLVSAKVNTTDISSSTLPYSTTVKENVSVNITVKLGAIVYIKNEPYQVFIGAGGTTWIQYQSYIGNGSAWDTY